MTTASAMPEFRVRFGEIADTPALVPLINVAFLPEQIAIDGHRISSERVQPYFKTGKFLVLENEQGLAGCVYAELRGTRGYIGLLALRPELKGRGLGRKLMVSAEEYLARAGCEGADLRTISARDDLVPRSMSAKADRRCREARAQMWKSGARPRSNRFPTLVWPKSVP